MKRSLRRLGVALAGGGLLVAGAVMLVLPGPGLVVIVAALAVWPREFAWARRWLDRARARLDDVRTRVKARRVPAANTGPTSPVRAVYGEPLTTRTWPVTHDEASDAR